MRKICLFLLLCSPLMAANTKSEPTIKQPVDQTDIFAIPLDEDEQSQDEELQEMEQHKK